MKNIILILVFGILMIGCKKNKEEPDTILVVTVKDNSGAPIIGAQITITTCSQIVGSACTVASFSSYGFTDDQGRYTATNALADVFYQVDINDFAGHDSLYTYQGRLPAHKTSYANINFPN